MNQELMKMFKLIKMIKLLKLMNRHLRHAISATLRLYSDQTDENDKIAESPLRYDLRRKAPQDLRYAAILLVKVVAPSSISTV